MSVIVTFVNCTATAHCGLNYSVPRRAVFGISVGDAVFGMSVGDSISLSVGHGDASGFCLVISVW